MALSTMRGTIDRRILANYHVEAAALDAALPGPFRPRTVDGYGVGGVCFIRLTGMRPAFLPGAVGEAVGMASENAAHRIAVEWEDGGEHRDGVYVPRRDTSSRLNAAFGGRLFAGEYHRARFEVSEGNNRYDVAMESTDGRANVRVAGEVADDLPGDSVFGAVEAASTFFEEGSVGYSPAGGDEEFEGIELDTEAWSVRPLAVETVESSYFEDSDRFPPETVAFDHALLMEDIDHEWRQREPICAATPAD